MGNRPGARESFRRTIELDPENRGGNGKAAAIALAEIELDESAFAPAAEAARRATTLAPGEANAWVLLGLAQRGLGQLPDAVSSLERAAELAPSRADIAHNLGTAYLAQRRLPEAEAAFRRAVELDPKFSEAGAALARVQSARSEPATANRSRREPPRRDLGATIAPVDYQPLGIRGLIVQQVAPGGLAAKAGLRVDDLILRADGNPLTSVATLMAMVKNSSASVLRLSVLRAGKPLDVSLPLG
jgi:tetratricopeptide (TPR) repeat protein